MIEIILSVGVIAFLFAFLSFSLDNEHFGLKLLLLLAVFVALIFVPRATLDDVCEPVIENATVSGSTTQYDYTIECYSNTSNTTNEDFYKFYIWVFRSVIAYVFIYFAYKFFKETDKFQQLQHKLRGNKKKRF